MIQIYHADIKASHVNQRITFFFFFFGEKRKFHGFDVLYYILNEKHIFVRFEFIERKAIKDTG